MKNLLGKFELIPAIGHRYEDDPNILTAVVYNLLSRGGRGISVPEALDYYQQINHIFLMRHGNYDCG